MLKHDNNTHKPNQTRQKYAQESYANEGLSKDNKSEENAWECYKHTQEQNPKFSQNSPKLKHSPWDSPIPVIRTQRSAT